MWAFESKFLMISYFLNCQKYDCEGDINDFNFTCIS